MQAREAIKPMKTKQVIYAKKARQKKTSKKKGKSNEELQRNVLDGLLGVVHTEIVDLFN